MTDYNSVPPQNYDPSSAFADAVQRARQIAAKIHSGVETTGTKRSLEEMQGVLGGATEAKKIALSEEKGLVQQQLASIQAQRSLGGIAHAITVEEWKVPDKMVGLIIGRGGEQITRLQAESGCKVQMAADSNGLSDRICTLTGSRQAIEKAKELMSSIINRGGPPAPVLDTNHVPDGHSLVEMLIPGPKVGLVIGKGGETIRNLQERAAVKMVLIQDGPQQTSSEKPLRITGEPDKCEYAKQLVMDLITEKELESLQRGGFENTNEYGSAPGGGAGQRQTSGNTHEIMVPKQAVGVVIGKGGDMIKKIQQDSGARVQFLNVKEEGPEDKVCVMTGSPEQIQAASTFINDLIQSVILRDQQNVGRGRGRGRPADGSPSPGAGNRGPRPDLPEVHYAVPSNKCGLVIGKGGETIKNINQTSGAYVTLSALPPPNPQDKIFVIRGQMQQIEHAKELINERISGVGTVVQTTNPQNQQQNFPPQFQQQQQQQQQFQQATGQPAQPYAPQGWANAYQPWQGQATPATDPNAAAWAAYYSQFYSQQQQAQQMQPPAQPGMSPAVSQPGMPPQPDQTQANLQQPAAAAPPATGVSGTAAPVGATAMQQPDYSAAWAEYYRSLGMFREAEMIEGQARATAQITTAVIMPQPGQTFSQPATTPTQTAPVPAPVPQPTQPPAPPGQAVAASVPQPAPPTQQPPVPAAPPAPVPTGVPAPGQPPQQPFPPGGAQPQWAAPSPFPQQFGQQQPNAFVGFNYPHFGQQQFAAAAPQ